MKKHIYRPLLFFFIWLLLNPTAANADTSSTSQTSEVEYRYYKRLHHREGRMYHVFLPPVPRGLFYYTKVRATGNIDDTPKKESIVLMLVDTQSKDLKSLGFIQAFLLVSTTEAQTPKKKALFKLYDSGFYNSDVPAKAVQLRNPPFVFTKIPESLRMPYYNGISIELVDLTGDGTLDIWVELAYAVIVISFQNGEFKEVFSSYTVPMDQPPEYVDLDNDGTYEIKIPYKIYMDEVERAAYPTWISLYDWDGTMYDLNNPKYYSRDDDVYVQLLLHYNDRLIREKELAQYNHPLLQRGEFRHYFETYKFYMGLANYYSSGSDGYLKWIVKEGKNDDYIKAAKSILMKKSITNTNAK